MKLESTERCTIFAKKFYNLTVKINGRNAIYSLFFSLPQEFNAFAALFCQTVYVIKMKLLMSVFFQPGFHRSLESFIVWIVNTTKMKFQISKQIGLLVTAGPVRVI